MLSLRALAASSRRAAAAATVALQQQLFGQSLRRPVATSAVRLVKELKVHEDGDRITVEAVAVESERKAYLVPQEATTTTTTTTTDQSAKHHQHCNVCPLCRLNLRRLSYSDVLILQQFIESEGTLMRREVTGLCHRSHAKVKGLVAQAQAARLLPRPPGHVSTGPWEEENRYFEWPRRRRDQPMRVIRKEFWENSA
ncbi:Structural constituent of ribosome [Tyrophagus putrescentiae]|nr:Structural constituent of ribosome [Tyrophagus putrescentiae]